MLSVEERAKGAVEIVKSVQKLGKESGFEFTRDVPRGIYETFDIATVECEFCSNPTPLILAHRHQDAYIGDDCCWDERLRSSE